jgi:hypothetical protein
MQHDPFFVVGTKPGDEVRVCSLTLLLDAFSLTVLSLHRLPFGLALPLLLFHGATMGLLGLAPIFFKQARIPHSPPYDAPPAFGLSQILFK